MKKIGILTFHGADNFGCVLQCMALQNTVKSLYPDSEVEVVNYVMPNLLKKRLLISKSQYKETEKKCGKKAAAKQAAESLKTLAGRWKRVRKFQSFREKELNLSGAAFTEESEFSRLHYDVCLVGSDQVWNWGLTKNKEKLFFLEGAQSGAVKISYAASTGHSRFGIQEAEWLKEHIAGMDMVSVREKSALKAMEDIAGKEISVCLDPALLHDAEYWRFYEKKPKHMGNKKYVFMYGLGYAFCKSQEMEACRLAGLIAQKEGLEVIHSYYGAYKKRFAPGAKHCYYQGPYEFLWLIDHAEYVISCSYHGTVFSIIFQKPFYTYSTGGNSARMEDLVQTLGIADRYLDREIDYEQIDWKIDWEKVKKNWNREQEYSLEYLKKAIGKEKNGAAK